jgi:hypothetical protein
MKMLEAEKDLALFVKCRNSDSVIVISSYDL